MSAWPQHTPAPASSPPSASPAGSLHVAPAQGVKPSPQLQRQSRLLADLQGLDARLRSSAPQLSSSPPKHVRGTSPIRATSPPRVIQASAFSQGLSRSPGVPPPAVVVPPADAQLQRGSRTPQDALNVLNDVRQLTTSAAAAQAVAAAVPLQRVSLTRPCSRGRPSANPPAMPLAPAQCCSSSSSASRPSDNSDSLVGTVVVGPARVSYSPSRAKQQVDAAPRGAGSGVFIPGGARTPLAVATGTSVPQAKASDNSHRDRQPEQIMTVPPKVVPAIAPFSEALPLADQVASLKEELEATGARRLGSVIGALIRLVTAVEAEGQACLKLLEREREERKAETAFLREELRGLQGLQAEAAANGKARHLCSSGFLQNDELDRNNHGVGVLCGHVDEDASSGPAALVAKASAAAAAAAMAEWQQQLEILTRDCSETRRKCTDASAAIERQVKELAVSTHGMSDRLRNLEEGFCNMASLIPTVREEALASAKDGESKPPWETRQRIDNGSGRTHPWGSSSKELGDAEEQRILDLVLAARGDDFSLSGSLLSAGPCELPAIQEETSPTHARGEVDGSCVDDSGQLARPPAEASSHSAASPPGAAAAEALTVLRNMSEPRTQGDDVSLQ